MWWEIMRWGKANNFQKLDFVWIDTEDAKLAARGELSPARFRDGTTYFKLGFGGALLLVPPAQSKVFNPLFRFAYNCGGARILASQVFSRMIARYWSHKSGE
jgi:hypothetical protein